MITWRKLALAVLFLSACTDVPTDAQSGDSVIESEPSPFSFLGPQNLRIFWEQSQIINIAIAGGSDQSLLENAASTAANNWNSEVLTRFSDLPRFDQVGGSGLSKPRIFINYDDSEWTIGNPNFGYCGSTNEGGGSGSNQERVVNIAKKDTTDFCFGRIINDLAGVIAHEFSEALGVDSPNTTETVWCVANVQATAPLLNKVPCAWEQQLVYDGYAVRPIAIKAPWFSLPVVRSLYIQGVSIDTIMPGDTVEFRAVAWAGPEPSQPFPRDSTAIDTVQATWTRSNPLALTIVSQTDSTVLVTAGAQSGQSYLIIEAAVQRKAVFPWPKDSINIVVETGSGLDPSFDMLNSVWRNTDQYLIATGTRGPNIQYQWQFEAGGPSTAFSPDTLYEFMGHTVADTYAVTMKIKDTSTGATEQQTQQLVVTNSQLSMTGPIFVMDKLLKQYNSSENANWFERYDPATSLFWLSTGVDRSNYPRIWPAGEYIVRLRTEVPIIPTGRDFLDVEVCTGCLATVVLGGQSRSPLLQRWGFFGGGPWISGGSRGSERLLRLYDPTGLHEPNSPFVNADWLTGTGGYFEASDWAVEWSEPTTLADDVLVVDFVVHPVVSGPYVFGFAVDPDLGMSAANDHGGYDAALGLTYAFETGMAVGYLLLSDGLSATNTVGQYGARVHAPRTREKAWDAHRSHAQSVTQVADDVQFIIGGPAVTGVSAWRLVMIRAADPVSLRARAMQLLERRRLLTPIE